MRPYSVNRGFTLIELMIVVSIMSILAAIALPMYNEHVLSTKLTEASSNLADMRIRAEQYFSDNRTYAAIAPAVTPPFCTVPASSARYFTYDCSGTPDATTFVARATSRAATIGMVGAVYTVNQSNVRTSTFTDDFSSKGWTNAANCWKVKKGQSC